MVYDIDLQHNHVKMGVGQYGADWDKIEAECFMTMSDGPKKSETQSGGFEITNLQSGNYLYYPNIHKFPVNPIVELTYSCSNKTGGTIAVRLNNKAGEKIGEVKFKPTGSWTKYQQISIPLNKVEAGDTKSLAFVFDGKEGEELIRVDAFKIKAGK